MKKTIKISLLTCLVLLVSMLMFTACNITDFLQKPEETTRPPHVHTVVIDSAVTPTCTATGLTEGKHCSACNEVLVKQTVVDATGHTFGNDLICDACQFEKEANEISFKTLQTNGTSVRGTVSNDTMVFSFIDEVAVSGKATYTVSLDIYGMQPVVTKTVALEIGDNTFFVLEQIGDKITLYTVTIRRRPIYTVTFFTNGGTSVPVQYVEEGSFATEPTTSRTGYTFDSWNYDFANPIMQSINIGARWNARSDTAYRVEYYLQNLDDNNYPSTPNYVDNLVGTTDTSATAEQKAFDYFTFNAAKSVMSGTINANGSLVLKVYYTRNTYTLSNANTEFGIITYNHSYKYGTSVTTSATANLGCDFIGWYSGDTLLSTNTTYTFEIDKNVEARFAPQSEMANIHFTATTTTCSITGIKDATITEIIVPDYITSIASGAFSGCTALTSITFDGTVEQWNAITFGSKWNLNVPATTVICFDGVVCPSHIEVIDETVAPSCTETGLTEGKHCSVCNEVFVAQTTIDALGHSYTSTVTPPTATEDAYALTYTCSDCGDTYTEAIVTTDVAITANNRTMIGYTGEEGENLIIPAVFQHNGTWYKVTTIGDRAFEDCDNLTSVTIGNSVTTISDDAFRYCSKLTSVTIPDSVTTIGDYAFSGCFNLTSVTIGDSVTAIGDRAFLYCYNLTSIVVDGNNPAYQSINGNLYSKDGTVLIAYAIGKTDTSFTIPDSVTAIGDYAFYHCSKLTSVTIGNSVTTIGNYAFSWCYNLTSVTIGNSVTTIGDDAFRYCSKLTSVTIPDSVTTIGDYAFSNCSNFTSVTIPDSVTTNVDRAFLYCYNLTSIVVDGNNPAYQSINGNLYSKDGTVLIAYAIGKTDTSFTIPDSVTAIGDYAFYHCSKLTSVTIGNSVTTIGNYAFSWCSNLTSITFEGTVAQWNAITFVEGWNRFILATSVICSDGTVTLN